MITSKKQSTNNEVIFSVECTNISFGFHKLNNVTKF